MSVATTVELQAGDDLTTSVTANGATTFDAQLVAFAATWIAPAPSA